MGNVGARQLRENAYRLEDFGCAPIESEPGCFRMLPGRPRPRLPKGDDHAEANLGYATRNVARRRAEQPKPLDWRFDPSTPTCDFFEGHNLDNVLDFQDAVANFIFAMERGEFLAWEAVVTQEQGLPLTQQQRAALEHLINLSDCHDNSRVRYINGMPRTDEPWYAILNKMVPRLLVEPFRTFEVHPREHFEAWRHLSTCLAECAGGLSFPVGATSPLEVIPLRLRHKLWLQDCFEFLSGLGHESDLTLQTESEHYRIDDFVEGLREHSDTIRYFDLTIESLLARLILPLTDRSLFIQAMQQRLGMTLPRERLADYL